MIMEFGIEDQKISKILIKSFGVEMINSMIAERIDRIMAQSDDNKILDKLYSDRLKELELKYMAMKNTPAVDRFDLIDRYEYFSILDVMTYLEWDDEKDEKEDNE